MTDKRRREIAEAFRAKLDAGEHRKAALQSMRAAFGVARSSIYRYCARFGIKTS